MVANYCLDDIKSFYKHKSVYKKLFRNMRILFLKMQFLFPLNIYSLDSTKCGSRFKALSHLKSK